jgi:hypothetical protein
MANLAHAATVRNLILVTLLLACGTAEASEWVSAAKTDITEIFFDVSSIRVEGPIRRAWVKSVLKPHTTKYTGGDANKWWSETRERIAFNCSDETSREEATTVYYDDGSNESSDGTNLWRPVAPDTVGSAEMRFICAWAKK